VSILPRIVRPDKGLSANRLRPFPLDIAKRAFNGIITGVLKFSSAIDALTKNITLDG
jgi:hypothetical protein